jgi:hypothetical protein
MTVLNFNAEPKTHVLVMTFKTRNGRRVSENFPISARQKDDPQARAAAISGAQNYGDGRGWRYVNFNIVEAKA